MAVHHLRVAGVQLECRLGRGFDNRSRARLLVGRAASSGARLVVLPELFSPGYAVSRTLWRFAEAGEGPTLRWLEQTAAEHGVYLGGGYVERDGLDFYNCWALVDPAGKVLGRTRKTFTEYGSFAPGAASTHVIETPLGTVGVGICADNHRTVMLQLMQRERVDLVLMPHAWPLPRHRSVTVSADDVAHAEREADDLARLYARNLGVPAVLVNQVGPLGSRWDGVMGRLFDPAVFRFGGHSSIADASGQVLCRLGAEQGVMVADVMLDPAHRIATPPEDHLGYVTPAHGTALFRHLLVPAGSLASRVRYALSRKRRQAAAQSQDRPEA
jgi:N-carbamoylputrescine amidase